VVLVVKTIIQFSPLGHFFDYEANGAFFVALEGGEVGSREVLHGLILLKFIGLLQIFLEAPSENQLD